MFDLMVESRRGGPSHGRAVAVPAATAIHALALGAALALSLLAIEQVSDPERLFPGDLVLILGPRLEPPPPEGSGGGTPLAPVSRPPIPAKPHEAVPFVEGPSLVPPIREGEAIEEEIEPAAWSGTPGLDGSAGVGDGVPWGVPWGFGDGLPGGGPGEGKGTEPRQAVAPPVPVSPDMRPPELLVRLRPKYPPIALRAHLEGRVVLQAVIGERGDVEEVSVMAASSPVFEDPAIEAVRRWKYRPAFQNGRPVRVYFTVRVEFRLE